jgi:hypothetical protein
LTFASDLLSNYSDVLARTLREDLDLELTPELSQILKLEFGLEVFNLEKKGILKQKFDYQESQRFLCKSNKKMEGNFKQKVYEGRQFQSSNTSQKDKPSSYGYYNYENKENLGITNKSQYSRQNFMSDDRSVYSQHRKYW